MLRVKENNMFLFHYILQKYRDIKTWIRTDETHVYCNMFSMLMMCRMDDSGRLLGGNDDQLTSLNDLADDMTGISTLNEKPTYHNSSRHW